MTKRSRSGFFQLDSALDLLSKLESDYRRLREDPINIYAAFDFFVTAEHLPEWLGKTRCSPGRAMDARGAALRYICSDLANGAKHFRPDEHHDAVIHADVGGAVYGTARYGTAVYGEGNLIIELANDEANAIGRTTLFAIELAEMLLEY